MAIQEDSTHFRSGLGCEHVSAAAGNCNLYRLMQMIAPVLSVDSESQSEKPAYLY